MFAQVITAQVTDEEGLRRQVQRWHDEIRPGASGYLGTTGGITDDGKLVVMIRFATEDDGRRNGDRPEQGAWWAETEKCLAGVAFANAADVITGGDGGSDDAGFVQVMRGRITDAAAYDKVLAQMDDFAETMKEFRPDVLGMVTVRIDDGTYFDFAYFSSEAEARAGESKEMPADVQAQMEQAMAASTLDEYLDLKDPWLF